MCANGSEVLKLLVLLALLESITYVFSIGPMSSIPTRASKFMLTETVLEKLLSIY